MKAVSCPGAVYRIKDCNYTTVEYSNECSDRTGVICEQGIHSVYTTYVILMKVNIILSVICS